MSDTPSLLDMLGSLSGPSRAELNEAPQLTPLQQQAAARGLLELHAIYTRPPGGLGRALEPGDLIRYKPGMSLTRKPAYGEPAIVIEVLREAVKRPLDADAFSTPYAPMNYDIVFGVVDKDGDFLTYYGDSRRFERFELKPLEDC